MALPFSVEVIENCHVSPPPNSVPTTSIPLTFLDIPWFICHPVQRVLFYEFPHPTLHFTQTILPKLKHTLSLTLQHFFPLAGTIIYPPPQQKHIKPYILYKDGESFIPLTIAESKSNNFNHLVKNYPKYAREFHPLIPKLLPSEKTNIATSDDDIELFVQLLRPLALQVTIFPNSGISIGFTYLHVAGDGRAMNNFVKSWASICKLSNGDLSPDKSPLHDRTTIIKDPDDHLLTKSWNEWCEMGLSWDDIAPKIINTDASKDKLRTTFVMGRCEINKLRSWIETQFKNKNEAPPLLHISTFVVTCAFIWVCLIKTKNSGVSSSSSSSDENAADPLYCFQFLADVTGRTEIGVPKTYFGNCLVVCYAAVKRSELLGENGLFMAAKAIMNDVKELDTGLLARVKRELPELFEIFNAYGSLFNVAGSPKLRVYETDFGWGRPRKSEIVHIDQSGSISLTECRDEEGGIEVGLALSKEEMETFISIFELGLINLS